MLMKPGATISPDASMIVVPLSPDRLPILAIRDPAIPMSARYGGRPVPSMTDPPRRITSNGATRGVGATPADDGVAHAAVTTAIDTSRRVARRLPMQILSRMTPDLLLPSPRSLPPSSADRAARR